MGSRRRAAIVGVCAFVLACGDSDGATADGGSGESSASSGGGGTTAATMPATETGTASQGGSTTDASTTGAADSSGGGTTGPDVELQHGFVRVRLQSAAAEPADPFVGTDRVQITLNYEQCLFDFYVDQPDWQPSGDDGVAVFGSADLGGEGWFDRLCHVDVPDLVDCEVASIEQQLDPIPVLRISYVVTGELEGRVLPFGPLPTAALAGCVEPAQPTVRLSNGNLVVGYDGTNTKIWDGTTFAPDTAATDDEAPIVVDIVADD